MGGLWTVTGEEEAPAFATQQTGKHPPTYPRSAGTTCRRAGVAGPAHGGGTPPTLQGVILRTISPAHAGLEECPPLRLRSPCPTLAALCGGRRGGSPPHPPPHKPRLRRGTPASGPRACPGEAGAHPRPRRGLGSTGHLRHRQAGTNTVIDRPGGQIGRRPARNPTITPLCAVWAGTPSALWGPPPHKPGHQGRDTTGPGAFRMRPRRPRKFHLCPLRAAGRPRQGPRRRQQQQRDGTALAISAAPPRYTGTLAGVPGSHTPPSPPSKGGGTGRGGPPADLPEGRPIGRTLRRTRQSRRKSPEWADRPPHRLSPGAGNGRTYNRPCGPGRAAPPLCRKFPPRSPPPARDRPPPAHPPRAARADSARRSCKLPAPLVQAPSAARASSARRSCRLRAPLVQARKFARSAPEVRPKCAGSSPKVRHCETACLFWPDSSSEAARKKCYTTH